MSNDNKNSIKSLLLALAGTLGVGNIAGVAFGIYSGGAGSVFWLVISAFFSSTIKYCEVALSSFYKEKLGMISVIKAAQKSTYKLDVIYASLALILSFTMGSVFQAEAIRSSVSALDGDLLQVILPAIFVFIALICTFGKERIKDAVAFVIPLAVLIYGTMCIYVISSEAERICEVAQNIVKSAITPSAMAGGISGFLISSGIREGFARGLLSNEAGAGTSAFSHTSHMDNACYAKNIELDVINAKKAGVYGILEVFFDTLFLCPLTAFAILLGLGDSKFHGTIFELSHIFEGYIGKSATILLIFSVIAFASSTTLCWYYYGKICSDYLFKNKLTKLFSPIFIISFAIGLIFDIPSLIFINDIVLFLLTLITLYTIVKMRDKLKILTITKAEAGGHTDR